MTYAIGGLVTAADFNEILVGGTVIPIPVGVNHLWNDGTIGGTAPGRQYGYGQVAQPTVVVGGPVSSGPSGTPTEWQKMVRNVNAMAAHQGTPLIWAARHPTFPPVTGTQITWETELRNNIALVTTNRFRAAAQGPSSTTTATSTSTWRDKVTATFTVSFASDAAIRAYFNAGGQFAISASHPAGVGTSMNQFINDLCADLGTILFSAPNSGTTSIAGTSYTGVTQIGGGNPAGSTVATNSGFYAFGTPGTTIQIVKQFSNYASTYYAATGNTNRYGSYYGANTFVTVTVSYNGAGVITFTVTIDEVPNGALVSAGTVFTLTLRPPSTAVFASTWGTPTISTSVVAV
jgi:hypothetical protein